MHSTLVAVVVAMALVSVGQAARLNDSQSRAGGYLVNVRVIDALINQAAVNPLIKFWALNTTSPLQLPITPAELVNVQYVEYYGPSKNQNTRVPIFDYTFGVSDAFFNLSSYLAVEIYDQGSATPTFIAGNTLTVAQLKQLPNSGKLDLVDQNGAPAGGIDYTWN